MKRTNSQSLGEVLREVMTLNPVLHRKILEIRIVRAWREVLGDTVARYTQQAYVRDGVLHVSLASAVLRSELSLCRDRLVKSLNEFAEAEVIQEIQLH